MLTNAKTNSHYALDGQSLSPAPSVHKKSSSPHKFSNDFYVGIKFVVLFREKHHGEGLFGRTDLCVGKSNHTIKEEKHNKK